MVLIRLAKVAMIGALAAYAFIVAYDNVVDYGSNYEFVRHVLSMDTTFPGVLRSTIHHLNSERAWVKSFIRTPDSGLAHVARTKQIAHIEDIKTQKPYLEGQHARAGRLA